MYYLFTVVYRTTIRSMIISITCSQLCAAIGGIQVQHLLDVSPSLQHVSYNRMMCIGTHSEQIYGDPNLNPFKIKWM